MTSTTSSVFEPTRRLAFPNIPNPPITEVIYGTPYIDAIIPYVNNELKAKSVYIIASNSMNRMSNHVTKLAEALGEKHAGTSTGIKAHTFMPDLFPIMKDVVDKKVDCIITMGGSSVADGAQALTYAIANGVGSDPNTTDDQKMDEMIARCNHVGPYARVDSKPPTIPLIFIPTSLSGGEYSQYGAATDPRRNEKFNFDDPEMYPKLIVLDPAVTDTVPEWVWLSTGVRAIDHDVEGILSINAQPYATEASKESLRYLIPGLLAAKRNLNDIDAKFKCMIGCNLAMTGLICRVWVGGSHGIGHQLGPMGIGHGQTSCILSPTVQKYNARVNAATQQEIKAVLWEMPEVRAAAVKYGYEESSCDLGDTLDAIFRELGMPRTLKEVGITRDKLEVIADNTTRDHCAVNNPIPLTDSRKVMEILEACYDGFDGRSL